MSHFISMFDCTLKMKQNWPAKYFMTSHNRKRSIICSLLQISIVYINSLMYCLIDMVKTGFHRDFCVGKRKLKNMYFVKTDLETCTDRNTI